MRPADTAATATTLERLGAVLQQHHPVPSDRLRLDTPLEDLGIDSLATVELLWNVEDTFGIKLAPEPSAMKTLGDVVHEIDAALAAPPAA